MCLPLKKSMQCILEKEPSVTIIISVQLQIMSPDCNIYVHPKALFLCLIRRSN